MPVHECASLSMAKEEILPSTDPYEDRIPADPLGEGPSTTPHMTGGASGLLRMGVLLAAAAFFIYHESMKEPLIDPVYGEWKFPGEIQIHGSRQTALGGGAASFGALGVYVKSPKDLDELNAIADQGGLETGSRFITTFANAACEKSLLVVWDGKADASALLERLDSLLKPDQSLAGAAAIVSALQGALRGVGAVPPAGSQLYVTCDRSRTAHIAYGEAADGDGVRNTAPVVSSLTHGEVPGACRAIFEAMLGGPKALASEVRAGVAAAFAARFGRAQDDAQKSEL